MENVLVCLSNRKYYNVCNVAGSSDGNVCNIQDTSLNNIRDNNDSRMDSMVASMMGNIPSAMMISRSHNRDGI